MVFTYGVLQLGAALYQLVSNIAYAGAPGSFFDVAVLAGPFVRAVLFAAIGCGLLLLFYRTAFDKCFRLTIAGLYDTL